MMFEIGDTHVSEDGSHAAVYRPDKSPIWPWLWLENGIERARFATLSLCYLVAQEKGLILEPFTT